MSTARQPVRRSIAEQPLFLFALIFSVTWLLHGPLLRLPYFWDEAGYFIPAARDFLLTGDLIPKTTLSNGHPPLVMTWLAMWWKLSNYSAAVTRTAMLLVAAFGLLGVFKLAEQVSNRKVATVSLVLTGLYSVIFAQSSLAQLDIPVMTLVIWALYLHVLNRRIATIVVFAIAALAKETALIGPATLFGWELICPWLERAKAWKVCLHPHRLAHTFSFLLTAIPLTCWYGYHYHRVGYVFGNPEFVRYNLGATLSPERILIALGMRTWHAFGYMNLFVLTLAAIAASREPIVWDAGADRDGIDLRIKIVFSLLIAAHIVAFSIVGGAPLARYLVPVIPLVIILCVATLYRHLKLWLAWSAVVGFAFVLALLFNPPWRIAPEDNLAYSDFVHLHSDAAAYLQKTRPHATVLTAWPGSDELNRPFLGYVKEPMTVVRVDNFTLGYMLGAAQQRQMFDTVFIFNTKYEPPRNLLNSLPWWNHIQERFFDYHQDLLPKEVAMMMDGKVVWQESRGGQWAAVIVLDHVQNAENRCQLPVAGCRLPVEPTYMLARSFALRKISVNIFFVNFPVAVF
jgi:hypothetical protein